MSTTLSQAKTQVCPAEQEALLALAEGDELKGMLMGLKRFTKTEPFSHSSLGTPSIDMMLPENDSMAPILQPLGKSRLMQDGSSVGKPAHRHPHIRGISRNQITHPIIMGHRERLQEVVPPPRRLVPTIPDVSVEPRSWYCSSEMSWISPMDFGANHMR